MARQKRENPKKKKEKSAAGARWCVEGALLPKGVEGGERQGGGRWVVGYAGFKSEVSGQLGEVAGEEAEEVERREPFFLLEWQKGSVCV